MFDACKIFLHYRKPWYVKRGVYVSPEASPRRMYVSNAKALRRLP